MLKTESGTTYPEKIKPVLEMMVERIVKKFNPVQIILFGSHARNTPHQDSDIDLLVVLDHIENKLESMADIARILKDSPIAKDIVTATPEEIEKYKDDKGYLIYYVLEEGKILYER